jgi:hypothetical protein
MPSQVFMAQTGSNWVIQAQSNMVLSASALLKADAAQGARCKLPCARCLLRYSEGHVKGMAGFCRFSQSKPLIRRFVMDGMQSNVCSYCLKQNEKCFKVKNGTLWRKLDLADSDSFLMRTMMNSWPLTSWSKISQTRLPHLGTLRPLRSSRRRLGVAMLSSGRKWAPLTHSGAN